MLGTGSALKAIISLILAVLGHAKDANLVALKYSEYKNEPSSLYSIRFL
jgi:hypothetical protein